MTLQPSQSDHQLFTDKLSGFCGRADACDPVLQLLLYCQQCEAVL